MFSKIIGSTRLPAIFHGTLYHLRNAIGAGLFGKSETTPLDLTSREFRRRERTARSRNEKLP